MAPREEAVVTGVLIPAATEAEWRPVPGYEGLYEVSDDGRVCSYYFGRVHLLSPGVKSNGYALVILCLRRVQRSHTVHTLVTRAFIGPCPDGQEVRHLDGNRLNNRLANLAYGTRSENVLDSVRHGTHPSCARVPA
jgi:HNH endonuclease/NUMOD4 motif